MTKREKIKAILNAVPNMSTFNFNMLFGAANGPQAFITAEIRIKHVSEILRKKETDIDLIYNTMYDDGDL